MAWTPKHSVKALVVYFYFFAWLILGGWGNTSVGKKKKLPLPPPPFSSVSWGTFLTFFPNCVTDGLVQNIPSMRLSKLYLVEVIKQRHWESGFRSGICSLTHNGLLTFLWANWSLWIHSVRPLFKMCVGRSHCAWTTNTTHCGWLTWWELKS